MAGWSWFKCALFGVNCMQSLGIYFEGRVGRGLEGQGWAAHGVSRPTLLSLLNGKTGLSGDRALRIERAFGVKMDALMRPPAVGQTR